MNWFIFKKKYNKGLFHGLTYRWIKCDLSFICVIKIIKAQQKYRRMFETQRSGNQTGSREIGFDIRTFASPAAGQHKMSGDVRVPCRQGTAIGNVLWTSRNIRLKSNSVIRSRSVDLWVKSFEARSVLQLIFIALCIIFPNKNENKLYFYDYIYN